MWTEKYRPRNIKDLIGNGGCIDNLYAWLKDWDEVVIRGFKKKSNFKGAWGNAPNVNARAAMLGGPPGVGKTSTARIICASLGYNVVEMNASDTRNKAAIENRVKDLSSNKSLDYFSVAGLKRQEENKNPLAAAIGGIATQKSVIIMDEVDGLGAGDRGGIQALTAVIKETKTPIICICNDFENRKLMTLKNHCYVIKFQRPDPRQIKPFVMKIASREGLDEVNDSCCDHLITSAGNDIR